MEIYISNASTNEDSLTIQASSVLISSVLALCSLPPPPELIAISRPIEFWIEWS